MLSILAKIMLTASALAPVALVYAWVAWRQGESVIAAAALIIAAIALAFCLIVLRAADRKVEQSNFKPTSIEAADSENIGFLMLYLLPLFTDTVSQLAWDVWVPALAFFAVLIGGGYAYHFNPLLGLFGWHFYKVSGTDGIVFVLITRKRLSQLAAPLLVGHLTEYMLIDTGGKNDNALHAVQT